jgi:UDP-GlcNAc:undecaprenyl-phosphate GlcNAc-1-phosphate transferase
MVTVEYQFALLALGAALASSIATFLLIRWSLHLALVAKVRSDRWHRTATPNTGGIAIVLACIIAAFCTTLPSPYPLIVLVSTALAGLGVIDDRLQLRPLTKLAGQAAAAAAVIGCGVLFRPTGIAAVDIAVTFFWLVGITNAFNLIDNMDGLCAGVTVILAGFRFVAAVQAGDQGAACTMAILAGGYAGFLLFNYKPARIFMGDGGSMFAGFLLASVLISSPAPGESSSISRLTYPALTFLYPIFDIALVCVLRRLAGRPISLGGRDHSSHRVVMLGVSERKAVSMLWGVAAMGATAGLFAAWMPVGAIAPCVLLLLSVTVFGVFLGQLRVYEASPAFAIRADRIHEFIPTLRTVSIVAVDVVLAGTALLCGFLFRWGGSLSGATLRQMFYSLPVLCACHAVACAAFRSDQCGWQRFSLRDVAQLSKCAASGCGLFIIVLWSLAERDFSRAVLRVCAALSLCFGTGIRLLMRALSSWSALRPASERAAIWGAGEAGQLAHQLSIRSMASAIVEAESESETTVPSRAYSEESIA